MGKVKMPMKVITPIEMKLVKFMKRLLLFEDSTVESISNAFSWLIRLFTDVSPFVNT